MNKKVLIVVLSYLLILFNTFASTNILSLNIGFSSIFTALESYTHKKVSTIDLCLSLDLETYFEDGQSSKKQIVNNLRYKNPKPFIMESFYRAEGIRYNKFRANNSKPSYIEKKSVYHGWYNGIDLRAVGNVGHLLYSTGYVSKQMIYYNMDITEIISMQYGYAYNTNHRYMNLGFKFDVIYTYYFTDLIGLNLGLGLTLDLLPYVILYEDNFVGIKIHF